MLKPELIRRFFRFGVVGVCVTLAFMGLNWWFARWLSADWAYLAAYPLAVALHFCLNKWWAFRDQGTVRTRQVSEYLLMMAVAFLIQTAVFQTLIRFTGVKPWLASGIATLAQMSLSFLVMHLRVFAAAKSSA